MCDARGNVESSDGGVSAARGITISATGRPSITREKSKIEPPSTAAALEVARDDHFALVRRYRRGFTLVEVLVALIVLSIGMLGIAALYSRRCARAGRRSSRTQAVTLASDIADRIRANRTSRTRTTAAAPARLAGRATRMAIADIDGLAHGRSETSCPAVTASITVHAPAPQRSRRVRRSR